MQIDPTRLLQRQMEVHSMVRVPPTTAAELARVRDAVAQLVRFGTRLGRIATSLGLPLGLVFQSLIAIGVGKQQANFDTQHRQGDVPMHQAKVLNREAANEIIPQLEAAVDPQELRGLIESSQLMRSLLRIKVEDANDLSSARKGLTLANEYFEQLAMLADQGSPTAMWNLYRAEDEAAIRARVAQSASPDDIEPGSALLTPLQSTMSFGGTVGGDGMEEANAFASTKPCPPGQSFVAAVRTEAQAALATNKIPVAKRLQALANLTAWIRQSTAIVQDHFDELVATLRPSLLVQLAEKRSAITRGACELVTALARTAVSPHALGGHGGAAKDSFAAWASVMLKQVHVTVGAIAEATDVAVRDLVVASHGAMSICGSIVSALSSAAQPELQRKCIGYLTLALACCGPSSDALHSRAALCVPAVDKYLRSNNDGIRRAARAFGLVLEHRIPHSCLPSWDDRAEKAAVASDERSCVRTVLAQGPAALELSVLRYSSPCNIEYVARAPSNSQDVSPGRPTLTPLSTTSTSASQKKRSPSRQQRAASGCVSSGGEVVPLPHVEPLLHRPAGPVSPTEGSASTNSASPSALPTHAAPRAQPSPPAAAAASLARSGVRPTPLNPLPSLAGASTNSGTSPSLVQAVPTPGNSSSSQASPLTDGRPNSAIPLSLRSLTPNQPDPVPGRPRKEMLASLRAKKNGPAAAGASQPQQQRKRGGESFEI